MSSHGFTYCTCMHRGHCATCRERRAELEAKRKRKADALISPASKLRAKITGIQDTLDLLKDTEYFTSQTSKFLQNKLTLLVWEEKELTAKLSPQLDALYATPLDEITDD